MSKIKLEAPFRLFRGKICKHSDIIYKEMYGTKFTTQICHPRTSPFTANELAAQQKFAQAVAATKAVFADATQKATAKAELKRQKKFRSLWGYIHAREYKKLG